MTDPDALDAIVLPERRQRARGHEGARAAILNQLAERRLPGAILLHGPQGIGKATFAFEMAAAILRDARKAMEAAEREEKVAPGSKPPVAPSQANASARNGCPTDSAGRSGW